MALLTLAEIERAAMSIAGKVLRTPTVDSPALSELLGVRTVLKLEQLQLSGCFKPRGIHNKLSQLTGADKDKGVVTVSGGNHGIAIATICGQQGIAATVVMPRSAPEPSQARVRDCGANLLVTSDVTEAFAMAEAEAAKGRTYIHAYDDPAILAGHGTLGLEMLDDEPGLTDVIVSIGGGAMISGVAAAVKGRNPSIRVWGVETEGADAMTQALATGAPVNIKPTSISSTLGAPVVAARNLEHVQQLIEEVILVSDCDAVRGVLTLAESAKVWSEPAAGCVLAAAQQVAARSGPDTVLGLVICGGNCSFAAVADWAEKFGLAD